MALRVTGGWLGGRKLRAPKSGVRPTADRVRESLFTRLGDLEGAAVLDLFAGSGALGIEALSRGAASLVSVERSPAVRSVLAANLADLELTHCARVVAGDAVAAIGRLARAGDRFDLVLLDPPYASGDAEKALGAIAGAGLLAAGGLVVLERGRGQPLPEIAGLASVDERRYGDTWITQFRLAAEEPAEPDCSSEGGS